MTTSQGSLQPTWLPSQGRKTGRTSRGYNCPIRFSGLPVVALPARRARACRVQFVQPTPLPLFYLRNPSNPPLTSRRGNAGPEFDRAQGTLGPQNGERRRLACWFRRLAETNFESPLRSF